MSKTPKYPSHVYGDNLTEEDKAMGFGPNDVTDEGVQRWRDANSCDHIRAGVPCDGTD
jgi:hypothetical protein